MGGGVERAELNEWLSEGPSERDRINGKRRCQEVGTDRLPAPASFLWPSTATTTTCVSNKKNVPFFCVCVCVCVCVAPLLPCCDDSASDLSHNGRRSGFCCHRILISAF